jgi:hypothetical protein
MFYQVTKVILLLPADGNLVTVLISRFFYHGRNVAGSASFPLIFIYRGSYSSIYNNERGWVVGSPIKKSFFTSGHKKTIFLAKSTPKLYEKPLIFRSFYTFSQYFLSLDNSRRSKVVRMVGLYCPSANTFADPVLLFDKYAE